MALPPLLRTTTFRLTLLFLALFAGAGAAFLGYIYLMTAGEVTRLADGAITKEIRTLDAIYAKGGVEALRGAMAERTAIDQPFLYLLLDKTGRRIWGTIPNAPVGQSDERNIVWTRFSVAQSWDGAPREARLARGERQRLSGGEILFVGSDVGNAETYVLKIVRGLWGAGFLVVFLGLGGGILVSRNVTRSVSGLNAVVGAVQGGDLRARVRPQGNGDEFDALAGGLNDMLDRLERSIGGLRHAGDAIAHDLRSPLTRLRTRLEVAMLDVEAGRSDPKAALAQALEDADGVLRTFNAVLAISRLQAAGAAPDQTLFDPSQLAADVAELYQPVCEDKGLDFRAELAGGLTARGNREFLAQAVANILDNAVKYTPEGGAVMLRVRRRSSGEVEFSVTDTGLGVPEAERGRVVERFVRLENSRNQPGAGLGLPLVAAVAQAHGGRLELDEGPGRVGEMGPGLRVAVVLPRVGQDG
ncbi:MAG: HAMP domain-containing sensor histidine kinase [Caulobacteraceae bacterium]|nr:HAMP domain-containing sensor histidine kinase [Caulobacteraceae bacterium]